MWQMSSAEEVNEALTRARTLYQQNVSLFLFAKQAELGINSFIRDTARSLALRSIASGAELRKYAAIQQQQQQPANWADFACSMCGTLLFPPLSNRLPERCNMETPGAVRVRGLKRGRTRRRRASRCRAKQLQAAARSAKSSWGSGGTTAHLRQHARATERVQREASLKQLGDGTSRHCLVLRCRLCDTKRKWKGVEVAVRNARRRGEAAEGKATPLRNRASELHPTSTALSPPRHPGEEEDFVSLETPKRILAFTPLSLGRNKHQPSAIAASTPQFGSSKKNLAGSLLLGSKKKKKSRTSTSSANGSSLMDFLSSLND